MVRCDVPVIPPTAVTITITITVIPPTAVTITIMIIIKIKITVKDQQISRCGLVLQYALKVSDFI